MQVRVSDFDEVAPLFAELDEDLSERYGSGSPVQFARAQFDAPGGRLLVAVSDGPLLGCVGLRPLPDRPGVAELKRMYVRSTARRRGVAQALLAACEAAATELGYTALWLETGLRQPEAIALYRTAGYAEVPRFGQYRDEPDSVYLGRSLG